MVAQKQRAPDSVERVTERGGQQRGAEAARKGRHIGRHQIKHRQLKRHVGRDACTRRDAALFLGMRNERWHAGGSTTPSADGAMLEGNARSQAAVKASSSLTCSCTQYEAPKQAPQTGGPLHTAYMCRVAGGAHPRWTRPGPGRRRRGSPRA